MENLIYKFLTRSLTDEEWKEFVNWLEKPDNKEELGKHIRSDYYMYRLYQKDRTESSYRNIEKELSARSNVRKLFGPLRLAAASVVLLIGLASGWYYFNWNTSPEVHMVQTTIEPGTDKATLTLKNGSEVALVKGAEFQSKFANSDGKKIVYGNKDRTKELIYNYLTVGRGGQFMVTLSDGTKIWLNSASKLKYPVAFIPGQTREVELIYGEAYFNVSPAIDHNGDNFQVHHAGQEVTVIGTEFNIKAYPEEKNIYTILVEGKITVEYKGKEVLLSPGEQSTVNPATKSIEVEKVDAADKTAWRRGLFIFDHKSLEEIMVVLSRWYDVKIIIDEELKNIKFKGVLGKNQNIGDILFIMKSTHAINDYRIDQKTIWIK